MCLQSVPTSTHANLTKLINGGEATLERHVMEYASNKDPEKTFLAILLSKVSNDKTRNYLWWL